MRTLLRTILQGLGIRSSLECADAASAFEILQETSVDLILVDHRLPDLTGTEFVHLLRRADDNPNVMAPIVMVTAHADREHVNAARNAGVDEFLVKPVTAKAVAERIRAVTERRRLFIKAKGYIGPDRRRQESAKYTGPLRREIDKTEATG